MAQTAPAYIMFRYPDGAPVTVARKNVFNLLMQGYRWEPPTLTEDISHAYPDRRLRSFRIQWPGDPFGYSSIRSDCHPAIAEMPEYRASV